MTAPQSHFTETEQTMIVTLSQDRNDKIDFIMTLSTKRQTAILREIGLAVLLDPETADVVISEAIDKVAAMG